MVCRQLPPTWTTNGRHLPSRQHPRHAVQQLLRAVEAELHLRQVDRPDHAERALVRKLELRGRGRPSTTFTAPPRRTQEATRHHQQCQWTTLIKPDDLDDLEADPARRPRSAVALQVRRDLAGRTPSRTSRSATSSRGYEYGRWTVGRSATDKTQLQRVGGDHPPSQDGWAGSHELKGGLEYQYLDRRILLLERELGRQQWRTYKDNLYYYRGLLGLSGPDPRAGTGCSPSSPPPPRNWGAACPASSVAGAGSLSDVWRINPRLTLNLGLRYDNTKSKIDDLSKPPLGRPRPGDRRSGLRAPLGHQPVRAAQLRRQGRPDSLEGVLGAARRRLRPDRRRQDDPEGHRRQLPGAACSAGTVGFGVPTGQASFLINWWDLNGNRLLDPPGSTGTPRPTTRARLAPDQSTTVAENIDPNIKTPYVRELRLALEREMGGFNVGVAGVYRDRKNQIVGLLYDLDKRQYWSDVDSGYWVPFQTTVPASGSRFPGGSRDRLLPEDERSRRLHPCHQRSTRPRPRTRRSS